VAETFQRCAARASGGAKAGGTKSGSLLPVVPSASAGGDEWALRV